MPWYIHPAEVLESPLRGTSCSLPCAKQQVPILAMIVEGRGVATDEECERPGVCFTAHRDTQDAGAALQ
jgi:hypothetical protein